MNNPNRIYSGSGRPAKLYLASMYYVYYNQSVKNPDKFYVGYSCDLKRRLSQHNNGLVSSTKPFRPWKVVFYEAFANSKDAKRREKYFKTTQGRKALKIMLKEYRASIHETPCFQL